VNRQESEYMALNNGKTIAGISEVLFADDEINVYTVLDGASIPDLLDNLYERQPEHICLYRGELEPDMAECAPYLVKLEPESEFGHWVISKGWGNHWGIFALSPENLREMRKHFRSFLMVSGPDYTQLYFRYYDPRVLRTYLPTCDAEGLASLFGPVINYILEDSDPKNVLRFRTEGGSLVREEMLIAKR
jgi:Domain of unknown function (DUF4123)